jgi:hypothetical protein
VGYVPAEGNVVVPPGDRADVMAPYQSPVARVMAAEGQKVKRGDVLLELSQPATQASYEQARQAVRAAQVALAVVQGLLPLAALFLYRQIVNAAIAGASAADKRAAFQHVAYLILWAALVGLAIVLARSITSLVSEAQAQVVTDHVSDIIHAKSIAVDLEFYENSRYYDVLHRTVQEAPYRPTKVVTDLDDLDHVADRGEVFFQVAQVGFRDPLEVMVHQRRIGGEEEHEAAVAKVHLAGLEDIAAEGAENGVVRLVVEAAGVLRQEGEFLVRDFGQRDAVDVGLGLAVRVGVIDRIVVVAPGGHHRDGRLAVIDHGIPAFVADRVQAGRDQARRAVGKGTLLPVVDRNPERGGQAMELHHVAAHAPQDGLLGFGQLLEDVIDTDVAGGEAKVFLEFAVGDGIDAGRAHAAKVDWQDVGFLVVDRGNDALAGCHPWASFHRETFAAAEENIHGSF